MLIRAVVISVLLHLAMLLSPAEIDVFFRQVMVGSGTNALSVVIAGRSGAGSPNSHGREAAMRKNQPVIRQFNPSPESAAEHSDFGRFFRSTVEPVASKKATSGRSIDVAPTEEQAVSLEQLGLYRLNVARSARRFKDYPALAREKGWEGVVHVSVTMPIGLEAPAVSLASSSGYELLDHQALEMITQAVSLAILPDGMRGRRMAISLPVEYRLAD